MSNSIYLMGLGGAGGRLAARAAAGLPASVKAAMLDTDAADLDAVDIPVKLKLGAARTKGRGAGGNVGTGRLAAEDDLATIRELVAGSRLAIVALGLGGGSGTGAAPAVLRAAREAGVLTIVVATLPFAFEGAPRRAAAADALRAIQDGADVFVVVPNDRLAEASGEAGLKAAFEAAGALLGAGIGALCQLLARPGYIRLDFAMLEDLARRCNGLCTLGWAEAAGRNRVERVLSGLFEGPMLQQGALIQKAGAMLVGIVGGDDLALKEVGVLMDAIGAKAGDACHLAMGTTIVSDADVPRQLAVVVLAAETQVQAPAPPEAPARGGRRGAASRSRRMKAGDRQGVLDLELTPPGGRGRFKNVEPTILDGEDLDIPTFIRRGIRIEK